MLSAKVMNVNLRAMLRPPASRAGMVKVNMSHEYMTYIGRLKAMSGQFSVQVGQGGTGSSFHEYRPCVTHDEVRRNCLGNMLEIEVECVNLHS